ncbi:FIVAR domain-containing protein [Mycoplasma tullyi]|uniref:FIVAR domain-containing protein n=1 Tax=Mycoplasma tullyi TaxID=1612150 RepID=A0A7D7Y8D9_9MOLU|nr:FIVAR domain-containing protein [Mycoplasma tullyi]QMT98695.1 FIVAR domain-containing protein [Mycoplasma tullyi]
MKRKNILKFVSLLGIGSFVMLAAASCSQATNATQNPRSATPNDGNTNPSSGQGMVDAAARELSVAKASLTTLVDSESKTTELYTDYAKIQKTLKEAFATARAVLGKSDSTTQSLNDAKSTLDSAISDAEKQKTDFDEKNGDLVKAYTSLKDALAKETTLLESVEGPNYEAIKNNLVTLYAQARPIVETTLIPITGESPKVDDVTKVSMTLANAVMRNNAWKLNADNLVSSFVKRTLAKKDLTAGANQTNTMPQPGNYSFVAYSVNIGTDDAKTGSSNSNNNTTPNWNFAQRVVWTAPDSGATVTPISNTEENSKPLTDVSWIYSLTGAEAKYKLTIPYFGVSKNAYLYFPYKLVNMNDQVALQYKLNEEDAKVVEFGMMNSEPSGASGPSAGRGDSETGIVKPSGSEETGADQTMASTPIRNATPTVDDIKIYKIELKDLKFGLNTVEFSVPMNGEDNMMKVAPMIGNMYITSSNAKANEDKIYADLFGNSYNQENSSTAVTVDLLKGYSLAASYNTYIRQFTNLKTENPVYLVGLIGDGVPRFTEINKTDPTKLANNTTTPNTNGERRTFTIYVNAPQAGEYSISGSYISSSSEMRSIKFSAGDMTTTTNNSVTVSFKQAKENFTSLETFNTADEATMTTTSGDMKKTLNLKEGLNKVVITKGSVDGTPFIGNLTFTLMNSASNSNSQGVGADKEN